MCFVLEDIVDDVFDQCEYLILECLESQCCVWCFEWVGLWVLFGVIFLVLIGVFVGGFLSLWMLVSDSGRLILVYECFECSGVVSCLCIDLCGVLGIEVGVCLGGGLLQVYSIQSL